MRHLISIVTITALGAAATACSYTPQAAEELRNAELAIADGDMTAARSVADRLVGTPSLDDLSARDLARLSMVYMRMAEDENDNTTLVATAADLYRRACRENADSARAYYMSLDLPDEALASQLYHIVVATDSAGVIPPDDHEFHPDSIF